MSYFNTPNDAKTTLTSRIWILLHPPVQYRILHILKILYFQRYSSPQLMQSKPLVEKAATIKTHWVLCFELKHQTPILPGITSSSVQKLFQISSLKAIQIGLHIIFLFIEIYNRKICTESVLNHISFCSFSFWNTKWNEQNSIFQI